jgi:ABC-type branched-subunit amino acid transport system substrate-binding protein
MKRYFAAVIAVAFAVLTANAASAAGVTDNEIVIGTHLDLSGPVASGMPYLRDGMALRFDELNEAGGVHGRKIKLIVEDNGSRPQLAVRAVDKLIKSDGVFAIVNAFGSGPNAAVVKRATEAGVVYFAPWAASAVLHKIAGPTDLLFTVTPNYDTTTDLGLTWMIDHFKAARVGFIYQDGPLGQLVGAGVKKALARKNMTLAAEASYKVGDIDFSSQVARMKAANVQVILAAALQRELVGIGTEVKKLGWTDVKIITANPGRTAVSLMLGKGVLTGIYGIGPWSAEVPSKGPPVEQKIAADFKSRFHLDADENAVLSYAYTDWFVKGLEKAGRDLTAEKLVKALQTTEESNPIFYEPVRFKDGHISPESVIVDRADGDHWVHVSPILH